MTKFCDKYIILHLVYGKATLWDNALYDSVIAARGVIASHAKPGSRFLITRVVNDVSARIALEDQT